MFYSNFQKAMQASQPAVEPEQPQPPQLKSESKLDADKMFFNLIERVGSFGIYQKVILVLLCIGTCLNGQIIFIAPYVFYQDAYQCSAPVPGGLGCSDYVCSLPLAQRTPFIPPNTMNTLANKFGDYRCSSESGTVTLSILITYLGVIIGNALMAVAGDYFGRKTFVVTGLSVCIGGLFLTVFANHIYVASVGMMISVIGFQWIYCMSMTILSEIVDETYREYSMIAVQIFFNLGHLADTGLYYWLRDWQQVFVYFFLIPLGIILISFMLLMVDTPMVLVTTLSPEQALKKLLWIAKVNRVESPTIKLEQIEQAKRIQQIRQKQSENASKFSVLDLFRYPSLRWLTIFLIIVQVSISFIFFAPNLMLNDFQLDIFINGVVLGVSYVLSEVFCYFVVKNLKRKSLAVVSMAIILVCSIVLVFFYRPKADGTTLPLSGNIGILAALFIITFCVSAQFTYFYIYMTELFPTQVRVIGISLITFAGAITLAVSQYIIDSCLRSGFNVMIVFSLFALASVIASFFLPETLYSPAGEMIYQLSEKAKNIETGKPMQPARDMSVEQLAQNQEYGLQLVVENNKA